MEKRTFKFNIDVSIHKDHYHEGETDLVNYWNWDEFITITDKDLLENPISYNDEEIHLEGEDLIIMSAISNLIDDKLFDEDVKFNHISVDEENPETFYYSNMLSNPNELISSDITDEMMEQFKEGKLELFAANYRITIQEIVNYNLHKIKFLDIE